MGGLLVVVALVAVFSPAFALNITVFYPAAAICSSCHLDVVDDSMNPMRFPLSRVAPSSWTASFSPSSNMGCLSIIMYSNSSNDSKMPCFSSTQSNKCTSVGTCTMYSQQDTAITIYPSFNTTATMSSSEIIIGSGSSSRSATIFVPFSLTENPIFRPVNILIAVGIDLPTAQLFSSVIGGAMLVGALPEAVFAYFPASYNDLTFEPCLYNCNVFGNTSYGGAQAFANMLIAAVPRITSSIQMSSGSVSIAGWDVGGLFSCYTATLGLASINQVLCSSPYLWWNRAALPYQISHAKTPLSTTVVISYGTSAVTPPGETTPLSTLVLQAVNAFSTAGWSLGTNLTVFASPGGMPCAALWLTSLVSDLQSVLLFQPWLTPVEWGSGPPGSATTTTTAAPTAAPSDGDDQSCDGMYSGSVLLSTVIAIVSFDLVLFVLAWFKPWVLREAARPLVNSAEGAPKLTESGLE